MEGIAFVYGVAHVGYCHCHCHYPVMSLLLSCHCHCHLLCCLLMERRVPYKTLWRACLSLPPPEQSAWSQLSDNTILISTHCTYEATKQTHGYADCTKNIMLFEQKYELSLDLNYNIIYCICCILFFNYCQCRRLLIVSRNMQPHRLC